MKDYERIDQLEKDMKFLHELIGRRMSKELENMQDFISILDRLVIIEEKRIEREHA